MLDAACPGQRDALDAILARIVYRDLHGALRLLPVVGYDASDHHDHVQRDFAGLKARRMPAASLFRRPFRVIFNV